MFGQLQVYSAYSFGKSTIKIDRLVAQAKAIGLTHLALTDHHQMYGTLEFYNACHQAGIQPIIGLEITLGVDGDEYVLSLLSKDVIGYQMLCRYATKLSMGHLLQVEDLQAAHTHIAILASTCFDIYLLNDKMEALMERLRQFKQWFYDDFYLVLTGMNTMFQKKMNEKLIQVASLVSIPVVCANPAHYLRAEDAYAYHVLNAMSMHKTLSPDFKVPHCESYLKSESEMASLFTEEIIMQTVHLMLLCQVEIPKAIDTLPDYPTIHDVPKQAYLMKLCQVGLSKRFNHQAIPEAYLKRLRYELDIIVKMHYENYFLIVFDYVRYAKKHHILVGPGRGSVAGSLVAYSLGITNIDPLAYDLIFERFLNPERISMPDIDVDFQENRREEVIDYVTSTYGQNHACRIITFASYGAKNALKEVGKAMQIAMPKVTRVSEKISSQIPGHKTLKALYHSSVNFKREIEGDPELKRLVNVAMSIEDLPRNISTHAAGVVLARESLKRLIPLCRSGDEKLTSQYSKDYIEQTGLLKMDFLGLTNLTFLSHILGMVKESYNSSFDLQSIPLNDQKTFKMLSDGDTFGIFQLESAGMTQLIIRMKITSFDDLVMALALFRPGPMQNRDLFIERKHGRAVVSYDHPDLEPILKSTYGIILYQEQLMQIAVTFAGFSYAKADLLRKAISKKDESLMHQTKDQFISGVISRGYPRALAIKLFNDIEKFSNYGFNKAHGVSYGMLSYQLAYLKAHAPLAFYSALLTTHQNSDHAKQSCMRECRKYHVAILRPSINTSKDYFTIESEGIRFALTAILGVSKKVYEAIENEREAQGPFVSFIDAIHRLSHYDLSETIFLNLIAAGAFDDFEENRMTMSKALKDVLNSAISAKRWNLDIPLDILFYQEQTEQLLIEEKRTLGLYISNHPLTVVRQELERPTMVIGDVSSHVNTRQWLLFKIDRIKIIRDKRGQTMCFLTVSDETGTLEATVFSDVYHQYQDVLGKDYVLLSYCKIEQKDRIGLTIQKLEIISKGVF